MARTFEIINAIGTVLAVVVVAKVDIDVTRSVIAPSATGDAYTAYAAAEQLLPFYPSKHAVAAAIFL